MAEIFWYYAREDQQHGPVTSAELKRLASIHEISPDDLVWKEGMDEWAAASKVKGLFPPREAGANEADAAPPRETPATAAASAPPVAASLAATAVFSAPPTHFPATVDVAAPTPPGASHAPARAAPPVAAPPSPATHAPTTHAPAAADGALTPGLRTALLAAQGILWATCVMVVILGGVIFMISMLGAKTKADQADSAQVSAALFIGAYALARAGERACLLLERYLSTRRR